MNILALRIISCECCRTLVLTYPRAMNETYLNPSEQIDYEVDTQVSTMGTIHHVYNNKIFDDNCDYKL